MSSLVSNPPDGWSVNPDDLEVDANWGPNGTGTKVAQSLGIANPQPAMIKSPRHGGDAYIFTSGSAVYVWNMISGDVFQYTNPTSLNDILAELRKVGSKRNVTVKQLPEDGGDY